MVGIAVATIPTEVVNIKVRIEIGSLEAWKLGSLEAWKQRRAD